MRTGPQLRYAYRRALQAHLRSAGEETLREAYELGRQAVAFDVGVLELAAAHHDVLLGALAAVAGPEAQRLTAASGEFFEESLSTYEMVRRGYGEAAREAAIERRQAQTVRRLSGFLAEASLATDTPRSLTEVLQLVAEAAQELVDATTCIVAARAGGTAPWTAMSSPPGAVEALGADRDRHLDDVLQLLARHGGPVRLDAPALRENAGIALVVDTVPADAWLGAPLAALDGRPLGAVEVVGWEGAPPGDLDEALILHLAQMAAAALERALLYRGATGA